jgi:hypothetical protein
LHKAVQAVSSNPQFGCCRQYRVAARRLSAFGMRFTVVLMPGFTAENKGAT